ncbi:hypothetical protein FRACYDRAFT_269558 [Fragilariopsis cylindrus CCMP1102]|uniref:Uncharacterized protein n=1 Tax=Fragilariopsis cylindrus CCMP1102 TaxID=635003 RepID=A0A1E7F7X1_9STRA|nr:hypothetical protein FRACYDRAFT_269558 [Fragilariopsis cylindrus CCMP1102]|eukprot:OEU14260.1 hypothetical protein FRACYDRAFT_269558 [Fragilariopsis cylindrus CCMP1102]
MMMLRSTNLLFLCGLYSLLSATGLIVVQSFTTNTKSISTFGGVTGRISSISSDGSRTIMSSPSSSPFGTTVLNMADPSKSGTKKERMNRLAEMEELGVASGDRSVFVKAAGGFVAVIVIAIAAAASQGLLTPGIL